MPLPEPILLSAADFIALLQGKPEIGEKYPQFKPKHVEYLGEAIIIENVLIEEKIEIKNEENTPLLFPYPISIESGEFKNEFWIDGGEFKNEFSIYGGEFKNDFSISGGEFKKEFWIDGGEFKNKFSISGGEFKNNFWISGGEFKNDFSISGGEFKNEFWIDGGEFKNKFSISGGEFKNEFSISGGEFKKDFSIYGGEFKNEFSISGGEFKNDFSIDGGEFKNKFSISGGEFKNNFWISGGEFKNDFSIDGGEFKNDFSIDGGEFKNNFWISGGEFKKDFWIDGGEFKNEFWISGGEFKKDFWIDGGEFKNEFWISGGEFKNKFWIDGSEFKNDFWIDGGEFKNKFWISGSEFKNEFWIYGGEFKKLLIESKSKIQTLQFQMEHIQEVQIQSSNIDRLFLGGAVDSTQKVFVQDSEISSIWFDYFENKGVVRFTNIQPSEKTSFHILKSSMGDVEFKAVLIEVYKQKTSFHILKSSMGDVEFKAVAFEKYKQIVISASKVSNLVTHIGHIPQNIDVETFEKKLAPFERQGQLFEVFNQLYLAAQKEGHRRLPLQYYSWSLAALRKSIGLKFKAAFFARPFQPFQKSTWQDIPSFLSLWVSGVFSNYGRSWSQALALMLGLLTFLYFFAYVPALKDSWKSVFQHYAYLPYFLNPAHSFDLVKGIDHSFWSRFWDMLSRIIGGIGVYEIIKGFRKYAK